MSEPLAQTEEVVKKAVTLGADDAIAKTTAGKYRQTRFSNNEIDITVGWDSLVTEIGLALNKRVVASQVTNFQDIDKRLEQLIKLAKVSQPNPFYGGIASGKFKYSQSQADPRILEIDRPADYVQEAIDAARGAARGEVEAGGILFGKYEDVYLVSSAGPVGHDKRSAIELSIRAFAEREASGHGVNCASRLKELKAARAGEKAGMIARLAKDPAIGEEGTYDAIYDPLIAGSLLGGVGRMASAFTVLMQMSVFTGKLEQAVASELVTVRDNAAPYSLSNRLFDDEGVPVKENVLIEKGVLKTYLHNTTTSKLFKTQTTANAGLVAPSAWNIELDPGTQTKEELFRDVKKGLYFTNTWYTRYQNALLGDFSTIPRDGIFLVENGEITKSLKDIRISDNLLRILKNIYGISSERQHIHWWGEADPPSLSPYIAIRDIRVTRSR